MQGQGKRCQRLDTENSWDVAYLVIINWKCVMDVVVSVETKRLGDSVKTLPRWECCTDSNPGDVSWNL